MIISTKFSKLCFMFMVLVLFSTKSFAQTNPTPYDLSAANFSFAGFALGTTITYPASMAGHSFAAEPSAVNYLNAASADRAIALNSSSISSGSIRNEVANGISLLNSASNNIGAIVVGLNCTSRSNIMINFTASQLNDGANRQNGLILQYRLGTTGSFTNVPLGADYVSTLAGTAPQITYSGIALPAACNNQPIVQVRWVYYNVTGTGARDRIRLDDISIVSTPITGIMSGDGGICIVGGSTNISVAISTAGAHELIYTDGTSNFTVSGYTSGTPIVVTPLVSATYVILSINGSTSGHSGSAAISVGAIAPLVSSAPGSITNSMSWAPIGGASYYYFEYRVTGSIPWISGGTTAATSRTIYGLTPSTNYDLRARTHCSNYSSGAWAMSTFSTNAGPACQTVPVASASAGVSTLTATWPATGAAYYYITYKPSASTTWLAGGTTLTTSRTVYGLAPGSYDVRVRSHCADYSSGAWSNVVVVTSGIATITSNEKPAYTIGDKLLDQTAFTFETILYPNPFGDIVHLALTSDNTITPVAITVYDATGRIIETKEVNLNNETSIDLGLNYAPGVYQVQVVQNENTTTSRIVKR